MNYDLAKKLKDAGYSQELGYGMRHTAKVIKNNDGSTTVYPIEEAYEPTLSELIEELGDIELFELGSRHNGVRRYWYARCLTHTTKYDCKNPKQALCELWLVLNKKPE